MLDTIHIGMSGLQGYSQGLKVISNNVTNLNTPGFKAASQQFTESFYQASNAGSHHNGQDEPTHGTGLTTLSTRLDLQAGDTRNTGNALDASIDGDGFFMLRDAQGQRTYTRAGQFQLDGEGRLVSSANGKQVMGEAPGGGLAPVSIAALRTHPAGATQRVAFMGNLASTGAAFDLDTVKLTDSQGTERTVRLHFERGSSATANTWTVTVFNGTATLASGEIAFNDGAPIAGRSTLAFTFTPPGGQGSDATLDFSSGVTSFAAGSSSTLAFKSHDGFAAGTFTAAHFEEDGTLWLSYSNGKKLAGPRLALAVFDFGLGLEQAGHGELRATGTQEPRIGKPGENGFGSVHGERLEASNVDLSGQFSDLIVMQRGYQASSHLINTADEMITQLFELKGRR